MSAVPVVCSRCGRVIDGVGKFVGVGYYCAECLAPGVEPWEDAKDEWSDRIEAAHPAHGSHHHGTYATAMRMVGHRHSKGELVALVNWLLVEGKKS